MDSEELMVQFLHDDPEKWSKFLEVMDPVVQGKVSDAADFESVLRCSAVIADRNTFFAHVDKLFKLIPSSEVGQFFSSTLPGIGRLATAAPSYFANGLRLFRQQYSGSVLLSKLQVASLLSLSFLCALPHQHKLKKLAMPNPTFDEFFDFQERYQAEKLRCFLHYFRTVVQQHSTDQDLLASKMLSFSRSKLTPEQLLTHDNLSSSTKPMVPLTVHEEGSIFDEGREQGLLQVDFANEYLGGGVLMMGNVQEEIEFTVAPEHIAGMLIMEKMAPNEAISIVGAEKYSAHVGYGGRFAFREPYNDTRGFDELNRRDSHCVAIDAIPFFNFHAQLEDNALLRELNKAYIGFQGDPLSRSSPRAIATGNWGCGLFGGDIHLKSMLQWIAASQAGQPLHYYSFANPVARQLSEVAEKLEAKGATVGDLWALITKFKRLQSAVPGALHDFILSEESGGQWAPVRRL
eukprot:GILI01008949.1.p1 GENE.GILI01008949.1~~GILI01008949.1.p1  ORF type:complete len:461 (-),score=92.72 GILI01008949.1:98-1480(-)